MPTRHLSLVRDALAPALIAFGMIATPAAQTMTDSSPAPAEVARALELPPANVALSTKIRGPVAGDVGQYLIRLADGREIGAYLRLHRFPIDSTPPIWINTIDAPGQVVLRVVKGAFSIDRIPGDWIASDYLRERQPVPETISFIALNPPRTVRRLSQRGGYVAETAFMTTGFSPPLLGRTVFTVDTPNKTARAFSAMVYRVRDVPEARDLLGRLVALGNVP